MKLFRSVSLIFGSVFTGLILLVFVFSWQYRTNVVYGGSINSPLADNFELSPGSSAEAYPGEIVTYTHTLTNTGVIPDVFTITATSNLTILLPENPFEQTVEAGKDSLITVTLRVPDGTVESQDILTVTVQSTNEPLQIVTEENTTTVRWWKIFTPAVLKPAIWEKIDDNWPSGASALSTAVCDTDPILIFAGTVNDGIQIYDGSSWNPAASIPTGKSVTGLVVNSACDHAYASLYDGGVWQGEEEINGSWTWTRLGNDDVLAARSLALAGDRLFVAGDFGLRYWDVNGGSSWQPTSGIVGTQPVMYVSAVDSTDSNSALYAVQWQNGKIYHRAAGDPPGTWNPLSLPDVPDVEMRSVFGDAAGVQFVGTQSGSYQLNGNIWEALSGVPAGAGLRAGVVTGSVAYLGFTDNAGVYKVQGSISTPLNAGWGTPPDFIYDLVLAGGKLYAATTDGVFVYAQP